MSTKDIYQVRWETLIAVLKDAAAREVEFDICMWEKRAVTHSCGFAGCAIGWACQYPEINTLGLSLKYEDDGIVAPIYKTHEGTDAIVEWLGIGEMKIRTAGWMAFAWSGYGFTYDEGHQVTLPMVIERLEQLYPRFLEERAAAMVEA